MFDIRNITSYKMLMGTKERTDNALRAALNYLRRSRKTPLQRIADSCGRTRRHIQSITSEKERKPMGGDLAHNIAAFYGLTYEQFLELGVCLLNGADGEHVLKGLRTLASRENPETRHVDGAPVGVAWGNTAQTGVNHGTVAQVVNAAPAAPVVSSPGPGGGEIERDLCERIVRRMANQTTEEKIAFHTRMKKCIEEDGVEPVKE